MIHGKKHIIIINGPNLNLIGLREQSIYGKQSFDSYYEDLKDWFSDTVVLAYFQSNHEGDIIDKLHEVGFEFDGILLNAGGYTHTSVAIADAVRAIKTPVIEVHISNIYEREPYRQVSYVKEACVHQIVGHGLTGYKEGINLFLQS